MNTILRPERSRSSQTSGAPRYNVRCSFVLLLLTVLSLQLLPCAAGPTTGRPQRSAAPDRLLTSPTDNYVAGMEWAECWKAQRMPLKVHLHPNPDEAGFGPKYAESFKSACERWSAKTDNLIKFEFIDNAEKADIEVKWVTEKPASWQHQLGVTELFVDGGQGAYHASITLLTRTDGHQVGVKAMYCASLHELGHAFGLGHSGRDTDIMFRSMKMEKSVVDGHAIKELVNPDPKLTPRDVTTMKVVYSAKQRVYFFKQKDLDQRTLCTELTRAAVNLISTGDSATAIVLLREVMRLDSSYKIAAENLMAAYYNCGADLYNKQYYSEALPVLEKSMELGKQFGNAADLNMVQTVYRNCLSHR